MEVGVFVFEGADELDVVGPQRVFAAVNDVRPAVQAPAVHVSLVAEQAGRVRLGHGVMIEATETFDSCPPLDVLVLPGGSSEAPRGRRAEQRNPRTVAFVRDRAKEARVTASVCTGAFLLAEAGVLAGRRVNTHWRYRNELVALMAERGEPVDVVPERVVWDGDGLVTGGGVTSGIDVALSVIGRMLGERVRAAVEAAIERETPD